MIKTWLKKVSAIIFDRKLYGWEFVQRTIPYLAFGLLVQSTIYFVLAPYLLPIYFIVIICLTLVAGSASKNARGQFHPMGWALSLIMLFSSAFGLYFPFFFPFQANFVGMLSYTVVVIVSGSSFILSLVMLVVIGQRASLREKIGLKDDFHKKQMQKWKDELRELPQFCEIHRNLDEVKFVGKLFDNGYFNLTILWSCNVMEKVITAVSVGVIKRNPQLKFLFEKEDGDRLRYPQQLRNLGFKSILKESKRNFHSEILWHKVRNDIAHNNYIPNFYETYETIKILIDFVRETPSILNNFPFE